MRAHQKIEVVGADASEACIQRICDALRETPGCLRRDERNPASWRRSDTRPQIDRADLENT